MEWSLRDRIVWGAAFLEGEGCFTWVKTGESARIDACQKQVEPLTRLQRWFGGTIRHKIQKKKIRNNSETTWIYTWALNGTNAVALMMTLYDLMSPKRKEKIRYIISLWKKKGCSPQYRKTCKNGHEWTSENTRIYRPKRGRVCLECKRNRARELYEKKGFRKGPEKYNSNVKIDASIVLQIREEYAKGSMTHENLALRYNVGKSNVQAIISGKTWKHVGGPVRKNLEASERSRQAKLASDIRFGKMKPKQ